MKKNSIINNKKRGSFAVLVFALALIISTLSVVAVGPVKKAQAAGGRIALETSETIYAKGDFFTVVCRVSSGSGVGDTDFYVDFNTDIFKFMEGGTKAAKETGGVHINSAGTTDSPMTRTYSLQFFAKKEGTGSIFIRQGANVLTPDGQPISLSTDKIEVEIGKKSADGGDVVPSDQQTGIEPGEKKELSKSNKVKDIRTNAISMTPEFNSGIKEYEVTVSPDTETFFIDYILASKKARASISGNRDLSFGENVVKLTVTAENGDKRTYKFYVVRNQEGTQDEIETIAVSPTAVDVNKNLDKDGKSGYSILLYILIVILSIFCISLVVLVRRMRKELESYEEMEDLYEEKDDTGSGEGDYESGEIRGEDGESRYWD
ncbi:MAG: cadherin-like beta sandwich domain-containing protein [Eubacterium sp.]|nr:cadherin-like beta sandwich domain-containing protein [Eubacterium sp.]